MPKSKYSDGYTEPICEAIASGKSLNKACKAAGIAKRTWYLWLREHPELVDRYARAREERADWYADKLISLADKCANESMDPQSAKVAIDAYKWITCRLNPKSYGDKQSVEITQKHTPEDLERFMEQQGMKRLSDAIPE